MASTAPRIQPSMACGPCMAMMISGSVMNGPTPIMSSTFSRTAPARPTPRIRPVDSLSLFSVDATRTLPRNAAPAYYGLALSIDLPHNTRGCFDQTLSHRFTLESDWVER